MPQTNLTFWAIRHGDLTIHVLYTLDISITLVSIGLIVEDSYSVTFQGGMCTIHDKHNHVIGAIPRHDGLYHVNTTRAIAASAAVLKEKLTMMEAH